MIVAIVGNAAEHGGAVVVARRGKVKLAAEIALASAAQVAVFLVPAVALLSWLIDPLALGFRQVELAALAGGLVLALVDALAWPGVEITRRAAAPGLCRDRDRVLRRGRPGGSSRRRPRRTPPPFA